MRRDEEEPITWPPTAPGEAVTMKIEGHIVTLDLRDYSARQALRAWAMSIVAEEVTALPIARAVWKVVGREG